MPEVCIVRRLGCRDVHVLAGRLMVDFLSEKFAMESPRLRDDPVVRAMVVEALTPIDACLHANDEPNGNRQKATILNLRGATHNFTRS